MDSLSILIIGVILTTVQALDFSQFYLPPCCYIPPQGEHYSGYASSIISSKHKDIPTFRDIGNEITNTSSSAVNSSMVIPSESKRLYKLIIPIENEDLQTTTTSPNATAIPPSITIGKILFPTNENISEHIQFKRNLISNDVETRNISESQNFIMLDNEIPEQSNSEKRSLYESERKLKIKSTNESSLVLPSNSTRKKLQLELPIKDKILQNELSSNNKSEILQEPLLEASSEVNPQSVGRKMPAIWLKNLRRALYQSLTAEKLASNKQDVVTNQVSNNPEDNKAPPHFQSKQIWKTLRNAKLKYVDKLSQSSSELPEAIYLPPGQGPIVSGVVVNSLNKGVELRIASELYLTNAGGSEARDNCQCSLIHHGDIVMAYWSVSRIFNEYGQPALQYLVYPLPHIVPTPPQLHPFSGNDILFRPSPIDPLGPNEHLQNQIQPVSNYIDDSPNPGPNTPYYHPLPNGHHRLEISHHNQVHSHQVVTPTHSSNIHPGDAEHTPPPPAQLSNYRGVLMENEQGYTPEFLEMYRAAVAEHFRLKNVLENSHPPTGGLNSGPTGGFTGGSTGGFSGGGTGGFPGGGTGGFPGGGTGGFPGGGTGGSFPIQSNHPILPTGHSYLPGLAVQEKPFIEPTQIPPPPFPISGPQSDPNLQYPNSIQDILSPIPFPIVPSSLPPLQPVGVGHQYPPTNPEGFPGTGGHYPPRRIHEGKHPTNDKRPNPNKPPNRKDPPLKHPNRDKYPYPPSYPVFEGEQGFDNYPPPNRYPGQGDKDHHLPPRGQHFPNNVGPHSYLPGFSVSQQAQEPFDDRDRFDNQNKNQGLPNQNGIGTAFNVKDHFYYPDSNPKPSIPYTTKRPDEPKKLTQEIKDEGYILNF